MAGKVQKMVGQLRPANTTAASLVSPVSGERISVHTIIVAETSGSDRTFRLFHDDDGTTYDESTALHYDVAISANTTTFLDLQGGIDMVNSSGNLAVRTSSGNALNFTAYGESLT
jgi:hypothetical protein